MASGLGDLLQKGEFNQTFKVGKRVHATSNIAVFEGLNRINNESVTVFQYQMPPGSSSEAALAEIQRCTQLQHPNILRCCGCWKNEFSKFIYLVFEECLPLVPCDVPILIEPEIRWRCESILNALVYVHAGGSVHGSVRPYTVLVRDNIVKLKTVPMIVDKVEPSKWNSPEQAQAIKSGKPETASVAADIWSLGITLLEWSGAPLFGSLSGRQLTDKIAALQSFPSTTAKFSSKFADFIRAIGTIEPNKRPSASSLLKHPFITTIDPSWPIPIPLLQPKEEPASTTRLTRSTSRPDNGARHFVSSTSSSGLRSNAVVSQNATQDPAACRTSATNGLVVTELDTKVAARFASTNVSTAPPKISPGTPSKLPLVPFTPRSIASAGMRRSGSADRVTVASLSLEVSTPKTPRLDAAQRDEDARYGRTDPFAIATPRPSASPSLSKWDELELESDEVLRDARLSISKSLKKTQADQNIKVRVHKSQVSPPSSAPNSARSDGPAGAIINISPRESPRVPSESNPPSQPSSPRNNAIVRPASPPLDKSNNAKDISPPKSTSPRRVQLDPTPVNIPSADKQRSQSRSTKTSPKKHRQRSASPSRTSKKEKLTSHTKKGSNDPVLTEPRISLYAVNTGGTDTESDLDPVSMFDALLDDAIIAPFDISQGAPGTKKMPQSPRRKNTNKVLSRTSSLSESEVRGQNSQLSSQLDAAAPSPPSGLVSSSSSDDVSGKKSKRSSSKRKQIRKNSSVDNTVPIPAIDMKSVRTGSCTTSPVTVDSPANSNPSSPRDDPHIRPDTSASSNGSNSNPVANLFRRISEPFIKKRRQVQSSGGAAFSNGTATPTDESVQSPESRINLVKQASRHRKQELDATYDKTLTEVVEKSQEELKLKRAEWMRRMLANHESQAKEIDEAQDGSRKLTFSLEVIESEHRRRTFEMNFKKLVEEQDHQYQLLLDKEGLEQRLIFDKYRIDVLALSQIHMEERMSMLKQHENQLRMIEQMRSLSGIEKTLAGAYEAMFAENRRATKDASSIHQISKTFMDYFALASDLEKAKQQEELVVLEQSMNQVESHWRELSEQQRKQRGEIQTLTYDFQVEMENLKLKHRLLQLDHLYGAEKLKQELVYTHSQSESASSEELEEKRKTLRKVARGRYNYQKEQMFQMYNAKMKKLALFKGKM